MTVFTSLACSCVGQAVVQGDEGPVSGVAQGVQVHGVVGVRHDEEKEEGEVEQEVESEKEENNTQGRRHMWMDGMKVKRQMRSALSQSEERCEHVRRCNYRLRAVCSMLHGQLVCVRRVVHVVIHNALNVIENVLVVVHNVP